MEGKGTAVKPYTGATINHAGSRLRKAENSTLREQLLVSGGVRASGQVNSNDRGAEVDGGYTKGFCIIKVED